VNNQKQSANTTASRFTFAPVPQVAVAYTTL